MAETEPFVWGAGGGRLTPGQIAAQRKVADALLANGADYSPVQHWTQGAARVAQALWGGMQRKDADDAAKANAEENKEMMTRIASLMSGGAATAPSTAVAPVEPTPPVSPASLPAPAAQAPLVMPLKPTNADLQPTTGPRPGGPVMPSATVWGDKEAEAAGLYEKPAPLKDRFAGLPGAMSDPAALPPNAVPAQYVAPGTGQTIAPATPTATPRPGVNPMILQALTNPRASPELKSVAGIMLQQQLKQMQPETTDEIKEYNLSATQDKAAGRPTQSFTDWKIGIKKAGAIQNSVQIDQKGESEFSKESGKVQAKRFNELAEDAPAAKQMLSDVEMLRDLGTKIETGKGAEVRAAIGPYAEALGIKVDGLSEIQAYEAVVNRVAPNLRVKGSGAQSDYELRGFLKSIPSLGNTPEGNEIVGRTLQGLSQNKLAAAEIGAKALNGQLSRPEAEKAIRELPDPMKEWREVNKKTKLTPALTGGWQDMGNGVRIREKK